MRKLVHFNLARAGKLREEENGREREMLCKDEKLLSAEAKIHENADFIAQLTAYILFPRYIANNEHMNSHRGERWLRASFPRHPDVNIIRKVSHNQDCSLIHEEVEPSKSFIPIISARRQ
jgi:hypothetical protein